MPLNDAGRNAMLTGGLGNVVTHAAIHTGDPSTTGANEVTGGTYARQPITWNAAATGQRTQSGALVFPIPAGVTGVHAGLWSALTVGTFYGWFPLGGFTPMPCTVTAADNLLVSKAHGLANTNQVVVYDVMAAGLPTGLTEGTVYFVVSALTDSFALAATSGGAAIDVTADGELVVQRVLPEVFGAAGTLTIADATLVLDGRFV